MCALGYYMESEGIMTTGISLVRENAEAMQPPRTLWVPFPLGRPLGKPSDPEFQHRVIAAALQLLERDAGPVLADFPEDVPAIEGNGPQVCPVGFARASEPADTWAARLTREFSSIEPWYELSRRRRGRTTVGASAASLPEIMAKLGEWLDSPPDTRIDLTWLKFAVEDARACYGEALTAQPGNYDHRELERIIWQDTEFGAAIRATAGRFEANDKLRGFVRILAPRTVQEDDL